MNLRTVGNVLLAGAALALVVALVADAAGALSDGVRAGVAIAGLGLLGAAQAVRAYLDRSPRPLVVLALVLGLLLFLLLREA
ncbi:MAG: hypothetical protein ICV64_04810 [Thermoleophilia bacterium]|nr:hypothetical protein [Thermoleophilia bacterium]